MVLPVGYAQVGSGAREDDPRGTGAGRVAGRRGGGRERVQRQGRRERGPRERNRRRGPGRDPGAGSVAGLPVTHFESGLKPDAPTPGIDVKNADGGEDDKLATAAIDDVQTYWNGRLPADFGEQFEPVKSLLSYDSQTDTEKTGCGSVKKLVNAFYCSVDDS